MGLGDDEDCSTGNVSAGENRGTGSWHEERNLEQINYSVLDGRS
jgi:hypothetical protein